MTPEEERTIFIHELNNTYFSGPMTPVIKTRLADLIWRAYNAGLTIGKHIATNEEREKTALYLEDKSSEAFRAGSPNECVALFSAAAEIACGDHAHTSKCGISQLISANCDCGALL